MIDDELAGLRVSEAIRRGVLRERDELRAEVARLTRADRQWADHVKQLADERDMLRAEREVWGNIAQERNDLRAALDDANAAGMALVRENERLHAEVERLRAALDWIWNQSEDLASAQWAARNALCQT